MTEIHIDLYVDAEGSVKAFVDGNEAFDDTNSELAIRHVELTVHVPEPNPLKHTIEVPEEPSPNITVS